jgi:hypothetical protein
VGGREITAVGRTDTTCYEILNKLSKLDGFFGTAYATENEHGDEAPYFGGSQLFLTQGPIKQE